MKTRTEVLLGDKNKKGKNKLGRCILGTTWMLDCGRGEAINDSEV